MILDFKPFESRFAPWLTILDQENVAPWKWSDFRMWFAMSGKKNNNGVRLLYLCFDAITGEPIGYYSVERGKRIVAIDRIVVTKDYRRQGVATAMLRHQENLMTFTRRKHFVALCHYDEIPFAKLLSKSGFRAEIRVDEHGEALVFRKNLYVDPRNRIADYLAQAGIQ